MMKIRPLDLQKRLQSGERFQLIDVRAPDEYAIEHIPGAVNMPMEQVEARTGDLHPHDPVVLVCDTGRLADLTCEILATVRRDVLVLEGGAAAWRGEGLPMIASGAGKLSIMRQVQLVVGPSVLVSALLAVYGDPRWALLSAFFGLGLTFAGATGWCGLGLLLGKAPWNRAVTSCASMVDKVRS